MNDSILSSTLGLLAHLSIDELKEVLNDHEKFENITKEAKISVSYYELAVLHSIAISY